MSTNNRCNNSHTCFEIESPTVSNQPCFYKVRRVVRQTPPKEQSNIVLWGRILRFLCVQEQDIKFMSIYSILARKGPMSAKSKDGLRHVLQLTGRAWGESKLAVKLDKCSCPMLQDRRVSHRLRRVRFSEELSEFGMAKTTMCLYSWGCC